MVKNIRSANNVGVTGIVGNVLLIPDRIFSYAYFCEVSRKVENNSTLISSSVAGPAPL
jgi:hypothetical protein